jgi:hypothetical protein
MTAENDLPDLDDIDTKEKLIAVRNLVPDSPENDRLHAQAILAYLRNAQPYGCLFDEIVDVISGVVSSTTPAWHRCHERDDAFGADMIVESVASNASVWS